LPIPSTHVSLLCDMNKAGRRDEAWAAFQSRYRGLIHGWCLRRGLPPEGADDLTQDVLLKLFRHLPRYRHEPSRGQFRGWLKAVVNNALTDFRRRQRRRLERSAVGGSAFLERLGGLAGPASVPEPGADDDRARTAAAVFERVRTKLMETTWQAFYQTRVARCPAAEVAAGLGLSVASVYKAAYRVKQMLLEEYRHVHASGGDPDPVPGTGDAGETSA
jgi:RNA polymerase sigma factor (sigma-70 family)